MAWRLPSEGMAKQVQGEAETGLIQREIVWVGEGTPKEIVAVTGANA